MPLFELSAEQASTNRKANPFAAWGDRNSANRVEPVAKPNFDVRFKLEPGDKIFTVGSCFARNVETELMRRGFVLPMRELFKRPEFQDVELGIINNFGTPSIYNEFAWAFGERPFAAEDHILEVQSGKFADLHIIPTIRPAARDVILARRTAITEAFRTARECRILVMTLGLVEVWYDSKTGFYLNAMPRPTLIRNEPDRFKLHVLSFEEAYRYLADALAILRKHGRPDLQVLLTVSPVPLSVTLRPEDVLVANCYSKSVLRAVAETIVARHDFVTYYPSFESVTLSDRKIAWQDDLVHVTEEIVALNVGRMIDAYIGDTQDLDALRREIAAGGAPVAIRRAQALKGGSHETARKFYEEFASFSAQSREFAALHAQFLIDTGDFTGALAALSQAPAEGGEEKTALMSAEALVALGRAPEAIARIEPLIGKAPATANVWIALLRATMATGDADAVIGVLARWSQASPTRSVRGNVLVGRWFHERGDLDRAVAFLETAVSLNHEDATARIHLAEALNALGRRDDARRVFAAAMPQSGREIKLAERLKARLE